MAPPPPPPPPPLSAIPPSAKNSQSGPRVNTKTAVPDRNALLSQIRSGTKLKQAAQVNDRSSPLIAGKNVGGGGGNLNKTNSSSGTAISNKANMHQALGGLFAQGMPVLRSTNNSSKSMTPSTAKTNNFNSSGEMPARTPSTPRFNAPNQPVSQENRNVNKNFQQRTTNNSTSSIKASLEQHLNQMQLNQPQQQQQLQNRISPPSMNNLNQTRNKFNTINLGKHSNIVNSYNVGAGETTNSSGKGPAPMIPINHVPPLPSKPPTVSRSNSQIVGVKPLNRAPANSSTGHLRPSGPPSVKPPPPPKINGTMIRDQSLSVKGPVNVSRRQSFGGSDVRNQQQVAPSLPSNPPPLLNQNISVSSNHLNKPPPPPRNNSVPNGFGAAPPPPPVPPVSSVPSRYVAVVTPLPSTPKISSPRPPTAPPPPPPQRVNNMKLSGNQHSNYNNHGAPPPPPARNTSITKYDFESRFQGDFKDIVLLPAPDSFMDLPKLYPSTMASGQNQKRRYPPPPPPSSQPVSAQNSPKLSY